MDISLPTLNDFSLSFWLNNTFGDAPWDRIFGTEQERFEFAKEGNGQLKFWMGSWINVVMSPPDIWNYYTISRTGQTLRFYQNTELISEFVVSNVQLLPGWKIGQRRDGGEHGNFKLDELMFYNRSLTIGEIQQLYNTQTYSWNTGATTNSITVTPIMDTTYSCIVTQGNSTCTATVDIAVNPAVTNAISASIVEGESYTLGPQTLTTAGTYMEVFSSAAGCD
jgi:hypothetical protein